MSTHYQTPRLELDGSMDAYHITARDQGLVAINRRGMLNFGFQLVAQIFVIPPLDKKEPPLFVIPIPLFSTKMLPLFAPAPSPPPSPNPTKYWLVYITKYRLIEVELLGNLLKGKVVIKVLCKKY